MGLKDGHHKLLKDCQEFSLLEELNSLNIDATSVLDLNETCSQKWLDLVLASDRPARQQLLSQRLQDAHLHHDLSEWDLTSLVPSPSNSSSGGSSPSLHRLNSSKSNNSTDSSSESNESVNGTTTEVDRNIDE